MRNTFFLLLFLISGVCFSQNPDPFWDGIKTKLVQPDTLSTFDRDALTPKLGTILYHKDTGVSRWEKWDGTAWVPFGESVEWGNITGTLSDQTDLQSALNAKQATITGAASTIVTSDLTNNRALISNGSGKVEVSAVTTTELSYVSGVTSALQTQLNSKLNSSSYTAADVLSKLLTVDGSGSGLDADLLRGVHWGNVDTDILTTGSGTFGGEGINGTVSTDTGGITSANSWKIGKNAQGTYLNLVNSSGGTTNAILRSYAAGGVQLVLAEGGITANGTVTATNFILSSDKRLKENFIDLGNGYYSFNFKGSKEKRYGVIAQEVEKYAPELVSKGEDGYLKVAYIDLLIKKQAEQEKRITYLWIVIGVLSLGVGYSILKK